MQKRGQFSGHLVTWIVVILIIGMSMIFGFNSVETIRHKSCIAQSVFFDANLKPDIETMSSQLGSVSEKTYPVPCDIEKIYIFDLAQEIDEDIKEEQPIIYDSLESGSNYNVFFMRDGNLERSMYIPDIQLEYPSYRCFEIHGGGVKMYLEGYNGGTNIEHVDQRYNCGYIPLLMEDNVRNEDILSGGTVDIPSEDLATEMILDLESGADQTVVDAKKEKSKDRIKRTRGNVFIGRKVDIKERGTYVKIRIEPRGRKRASDFVYVESIPKECVSALSEVLATEGDDYKIDSDYEGVISWIDDPLIVWNFGDEPITRRNKKILEYELTDNLDCMRLIYTLGFGEIRDE
ncbi:MAG: hypothetical protein U9O94_00635 [Nanoarchaeota archaeon]|nr:hypothetical protein [Nanoarchaeota archaeon]